MRVLLDTHVLLWWLHESRKLSPKVRRLFDDPEVGLLWSSASTWEMAIKVRAGRLDLPPDLGSFVATTIEEQGFVPLPVEHAHAAYVSSLPDHHGDPFDRLLVAQSVLERIPLASADALLDRYGIDRIW